MNRCLHKEVSQKIYNKDLSLIRKNVISCANADMVIGFLSGELVCLCPYDNTSCPCGTVRNQISYLISLTFQKKKITQKSVYNKKIVVVNISPFQYGHHYSTDFWYGRDGSQYNLLESWFKGLRTLRKP